MLIRRTIFHCGTCSIKKCKGISSSISGCLKFTVAMAPCLETPRKVNFPVICSAMSFGKGSKAVGGPFFCMGLTTGFTPRFFMLSMKICSILCASSGTVFSFGVLNSETGGVSRIFLAASSVRARKSTSVTRVAKSPAVMARLSCSTYSSGVCSAVSIFQPKNPPPLSKATKTPMIRKRFFMINSLRDMVFSPKQ